ncbi:MAG: radical SAM protein, partial [Nitrospinaceae bacterium]|nr:radical SAM protein [Nitrospinaceae bacterium]NIR56512.1 radical SAM protein [Nitrospinaceae bacterium]NIS86970.1 radical SAM protein [Nitrospinaceae bacterium]NIT83814.1 radical SAM protein [Nitrospinaceae bacterium]NIU46020.1 radical SAM protein [Nitrospinaceae bacterium]
MDSRRGWVNVYMNRGCPYRCTYCHNNGVAKLLQENLGAKTSGNKDLGYLRYRDPRDMIEELKSIMARFEVKAFSFNDDCFTMNKQQMMEFLPMYEKEIGLPFVCNTTVLDVDKEILEAMARANCDLIRFGVETATERIRRHVLKRVFSTERTRDVFKWTREAGIRSFAFLILGNPGENFDEMLDTLRLASELLPDGLKVSIGYPYPGTEYHDIAEDMGVIDHEYPHFHNFIRESKLKWTPEERVRLDKIRTLFWIWMNAHLNNESSEL